MSLVVNAINSFISALFEIDEVKSEKLPDGRVKVSFVTTGLADPTTKVKTALWALLAPPLQKVDGVNVVELQRGPLAKRYLVEVVLKPLREGLVKDRSLGFREALGVRR